MDNMLLRFSVNLRAVGEEHGEADVVEVQHGDVLLLDSHALVQHAAAAASAWTSSRRST